MTKRYWTAVFEVNEAFEKGNHFKTETIWGTPVCTALGDITEVRQILEDALTEIEDGYCSMCAEIAKRGLAEANTYIVSQAKSYRPKAAVREPEQIDLEECIAKAGK